MKKVIGIYSGINFCFWDENSLKEKGIGGSETWAIEISKEFQKKGFHVILFGNPETEHFSNDGVEYISIKNFEKRCEYQHFDYFIFSRDISMASNNIFCDNIYAIAHDPCFFGIKNGIKSNIIKKYGCLSEWQKDFLIRNTKGLSNDKMFKTENGIDFSLYDDLTFYTKKNQMVWSTCRERGLKYFVENIFFKIKEQVPDFKLLVCSYQGKEYFKEYENIDGIELLPSLSKKELAEVQKESKIWIYPNYGFLEPDYKVPIHETFCITAIENAAANNFILSSYNTGIRDTLKGYNKLFGINEQIDYGVWNEDYANRMCAYFINESCMALKNDEYRIKYANISRNIALKYKWENIANNWIKLWGENYDKE